MTANECPHISVIVPTRDRCDALAALISSLSETSQIPAPWEVIVVDNGSTDDTAAVCGQAVRSRVPMDLRYVLEEVPGLHAARHRGAREARGDVLVYLDDDVEVGEHWLMALYEAFLDPSKELVGGPSSGLYETDPPAWVASFWIQSDELTRWCGYLSLLDSGEEEHEIDPTLVWGLNFGIRRDTLFRLGGFHPDALPWKLRRYRGDGETGLSLKAARLGIRAWYCPQAMVRHRVPPGRLTEEYFLKRSFLQGISDSFTAIRATGALVPLPSPSIRRRMSHARRAVSGWRRGEWRRGKDGNLAKEVRQAYRDGYQFHQHEVANDSALFEWVMRPDYLENAAPAAAALREWTR